jgi:hypothetical protein
VEKEPNSFPPSVSVIAVFGAFVYPRTWSFFSKICD